MAIVLIEKKIKKKPVVAAQTTVFLVGCSL